MNSNSAILKMPCGKSFMVHGGGGLTEAIYSFIAGAIRYGITMGVQEEQDKEEHDASNAGNDALLTSPPFYLNEFETAFQYIIDEYEVTPRDIAIFMPCAVRKPYSTSPSHQLIRSIISQVLDPAQYHIVVFGTCGIVPAELEEMYPYAHYQYMLGKCKDEKVLDDFLRIETGRIARYLDKTRKIYKYRIGYCLGIFREALVRGSREARVPIDRILPTRDMINKIIEEEDCVFEEGSLSMNEYLGEFCDELIRFRNSRYGTGR